MRFVRLVFSLAVVCCVAGQARAQVSYSYTTTQSSYTGAVGSQVTVSVYLTETLTGSATSYINANGGLTTAGAGINVVSTTGGTAAQVYAPGGFTSNPGFGSGATGANLVFNQGSGAAANNLEFVTEISTSQTGVMSAGVQNSSNNILLGSFEITVGTGTTTYTLSSLGNDTIGGSNGSDLGQSYGTTITYQPIPNGTDLDEGWNANSHQAIAGMTGADAAPNFTFTVGPATVPEPSSVILTGLVFAGLAFGAYRRRLKNSQTEAAAVS